MSRTEINEVEINGVTYIRKDSAVTSVQTVDGMPYVLVRTARAGVFAGYLAKRDGGEALIYGARRLWYWSGAASLSQLANEGTKKPKECKFPAVVPEITVLEVIEVLNVTKEAHDSIQAVPEWRV